ncbi:hypothetical protein [Falsarthrobacter nasiphocae]|uniref:Lipoprotein n=1 Tax=Falsarthrobacter nasiphocae TaxID=189863 RepID=A0AAE3YHE3_9MICC|nr:hypothetical protein [Falsarthrobacter nasiphocae]MDR6892757.1 hypothetical protein [Falsarthrobacter nasiphocae]
MAQSIPRRKIAAGAAWSAPAVALASAAPARAASKHCTPWSNWNYRIENVQYVGIDGALGTVSFWTVVEPGTQPVGGCAAPDDISTVSLTVTVTRNAGSVNRFRTVTLAQLDRITQVVKTYDVAKTKHHPIGGTDYEWVITFNPSDVYRLNGQHRFYTTLHAGDGGILGGRITNRLQINGVTQTFENQGDQVF